MGFPINVVEKDFKTCQRGTSRDGIRKAKHTYLGGWGKHGLSQGWGALLGSFKGSSVRSGHGGRRGDDINLVITDGLGGLEVLGILRSTSP